MLDELLLKLRALEHKAPHEMSSKEVYFIDEVIRDPMGVMPDYPVYGHIWHDRVL